MPNTEVPSLYNTLTWGAELEMTGGTRAQAARIIASHFRTQAVHVGGSYDKYEITENGRKWSVVYDSSITPLKEVNGHLTSASSHYKVEFVSPPLVGGQAIDGYQEIIRELRKQGFIVSDNCGFHVHIGIRNIPPKALVHLLNQVHSKQSLIFKALGINPNSTARYRYCSEIPTRLVENLKKKHSETLEQIADVWYETLSSPYGMNQHYDCSRYHIINLTRGLVPSSPYYLGTAEFRCFSATLHAGKLRAYIQFCLLLVAYCSGIKKSSYKPIVVADGESEAYKLRCFFLKLGCIGKQFRTMRIHWLNNFGSQSKAWRRGQRL
jgi:hypothetical protein